MRSWWAQRLWWWYSDRDNATKPTVEREGMCVRESLRGERGGRERERGREGESVSYEGGESVSFGVSE